MRTNLSTLFRTLVHAAVALAMSGCAHEWYKGPPPTLAMAPDEGIIIVGSPPEFQPGFISGTIQDGVFIRDTLQAEALSGKSKGGYLVGKFKATETPRAFGLWSIFITALRTVPCGTDILTFPVKAGKIQYIADFPLLIMEVQFRTRIATIWKVRRNT